MAIKMQPDELRSYAQNLAREATEAQTLAKNIERNINSAASNWEGDAQKRYVEDFQKIKPTLDKTVPEMLTSMSNNLKTMADKMEQLDKSMAH